MSKRNNGQVVACVLAVVLSACATAPPSIPDEPPAPPVSDTPTPDAPTSDAPTSDAPTSDAPPPDTAPSDPPTGGAATDFSYADCPSLSADEREALVGLHLLGAPPSEDELLVRRAYVTDYNADLRTPRWTAWRFSSLYRQTPDRVGVWRSFRTDRNVDNPVVDDDYLHMSNSDGELHRGHIAPYFIAGGDRDGDGRYAARGAQNRDRDDIDDACTVFEINLMTNIAPQLEAFNGGGGAWYALEGAVRDLADAGHDIHVIAGAIFGSNPQRRGPDNDIGVPDMFYQILVIDNAAIPFLFTHRRRLGPGCNRDAALEACVTNVATIERLADLDFFSALPGDGEARIEGADARETWDALWDEE